MRVSERIFQKIYAITGNDRRHSRFRSKARIHDSEIYVHPSPSRLRTGTQGLHATTADAYQHSDCAAWKVERPLARTEVKGQLR